MEDCGSDDIVLTVNFFFFLQFLSENISDTAEEYIRVKLEDQHQEKKNIQLLVSSAKLITVNTSCYRII